MAHYIATERLYLDKDGKVVKADDPTRASLLAGVGQRIDMARAEELGLTGELELEESPREKAVEAPKATKAVTKAEANKSADSAEPEDGIDPDELKARTAPKAKTAKK